MMNEGGLCITVKTGGIIQIGDNISLWVEPCPFNISKHRVHIIAPRDLFIKRPDKDSHEWLGGKEA